MSETKTYPISEIFTSIQGEGLHQGMAHTFIRFAGCSVGRPYIPNKDEQGNVLGRPSWAEECHTFDGRSFTCDTDFRVHSRMTAMEIMREVPANGIRICISGGEPLIHDLEPLVQLAFMNDHGISLETSGTRALPNWTYDRRVWVTCSPKQGFLSSNIPNIDEMKILVDEFYDEKATEELLSSFTGIVWVQPINFLHAVHQINLQRCMEIIKKHPSWRLSYQAHKVWGVR